MQRFDDYPKEEQPRVLGLSASLLNKSSKNQFRMEEDLDELARTMANSRITTARDLDEVERFAARPDQLLVTYDDGVGKIAYLNAYAIIDQLGRYLLRYSPTLRCEDLNESAKLKDKVNSLRRHVESCGIVLVDIGPWAGMVVSRV